MKKTEDGQGLDRERQVERDSLKNGRNTYLYFVINNTGGEKSNCHISRSQTAQKKKKKKNIQIPYIPLHLVPAGMTFTRNISVTSMYFFPPSQFKSLLANPESNNEQVGAAQTRNQTEELVEI